MIRDKYLAVLATEPATAAQIRAHKASSVTDRRAAALHSIAGARLGGALPLPDRSHYAYPA